MVLTLVLAVLIGVSLGLLGGGGSILTVPILVYAAGLDPRDAIATSLTRKIAHVSLCPAPLENRS